MKTIWDPLAKESFRQIARYINMRFGREARENFIQIVRDTENTLKHNPNIGFVDPLFANRSVAYRSVIINGRNKMVYFINSEVIYIAAFWDTRREPKNQAEQVE